MSENMSENMDGLRRNLGNAYKKIIRGYHEVLEIDNPNKGQLISLLEEGLDELREMIASLMCCYSDNPDEKMSDMSDEADALPFADRDDEEDSD